MQSLRLFHFDIPTWGNFGDKVLFPVVRDSFRVLGGTDSAGKEPRFTFTSAAALRREVDEAAVERINATADAVVIGGGGLFLQDTNPNRLSGWQWKISAEALAALEVPLIVYALGDNRFPGQPDFDELMRSHVRQVLGQSVFFGLRNSGSIATMSRFLGIEGPGEQDRTGEQDRMGVQDCTGEQGRVGVRDRIAYQPCPTTILDHLYAPLAGRRPNPTERTVAIQMLVHPRQVAAGYDAEIIHGATVTAARILVDRGWRVLSTPFHPDDAEVSRRLVSEAPGVEEVRLYGHDVGFFSGIELFSSVPYVLGGRGHAQMIPFGVGSIPISVDLHAKLGYFAADIGHPELVVPVGPEGMSRGECAHEGEGMREGEDPAGSIDPAEAAVSGDVVDGVRPVESRKVRAEALADRMVAAVEDAYASGSDLQADLADTRARFAEVTAENLAAIGRSLRSGPEAKNVPADGRPRAASAERDRTSALAADGAGSDLRTSEDIRAEEFHIAAVAEAEEVAAQQSRVLDRTRRELTRARRDHATALDDIRKRATARLHEVESERDGSLADADRLRARTQELEEQVARVSAEAAQVAETLDAERRRTAGQEARVLADKVRHGIRWRIRRLTAQGRR